MGRNNQRSRNLRYLEFVFPQDLATLCPAAADPDAARSITEDRLMPGNLLRIHRDENPAAVSQRNIQQNKSLNRFPKRPEKAKLAPLSFPLRGRK